MDSNEIYSEIIKNNLKREKILSKYACKSIMGFAGIRNGRK